MQVTTTNLEHVMLARDQMRVLAGYCTRSSRDGTVSAQHVLWLKGVVAQCQLSAIRTIEERCEVRQRFKNSTAARSCVLRTSTVEYFTSSLQVLRYAVLQLYETTGSEFRIRDTQKSCSSTVDSPTTNKAHNFSHYKTTTT
jgi:hypothetical protein